MARSSSTASTASRSRPAAATRKGKTGDKPAKRAAPVAVAPVAEPEAIEPETPETALALAETAPLPLPRYRRVAQRYDEDTPIDAVRPHPENPRTSDRGAIEESMEANGFYGAILVQESTGFIIVGTHRWEEARDGGMATIPAFWADLSDSQARRIMAADNRTSDLADYDARLLARLLQGVEEDAGHLAGTGFNAQDLDALVQSVVNEPTEQWDDLMGAGVAASTLAAVNGIAPGATAPALPAPAQFPPLSAGDGAEVGEDGAADTGGGAGGAGTFRQLAGQTGERGITPAEYLEMYNRTALRQIVLVMDNDQYAQVLAVFKRIAARENLATNTEVALYLINRYEADQLNGAPSGAMPDMPERPAALPEPDGRED